MATNSRYEDEWMEYGEDHQDALYKAHTKFLDKEGPPGTVLYQGKKTAWDISFLSMTQTNQKTKTVRSIALEVREPVELSYVDAGPPRRPYKPAWSVEGPVAPSQPSLVPCGRPCEFWICVQYEKS